VRARLRNSGKIGRFIQDIKLLRLLELQIFHCKALIYYIVSFNNLTPTVSFKDS
jgi:hypothetical protein